MRASTDHPTELRRRVWTCVQCGMVCGYMYVPVTKTRYMGNPKVYPQTLAQHGKYAPSQTVNYIPRKYDRPDRGRGHGRGSWHTPPLFVTRRLFPTHSLWKLHLPRMMRWKQLQL
jgi:hypothetical protein